MMQQPGYAQQMMQGGPPPGYVQQPPANWQTAQNQPAMQTGRGYAASDRLPAMPEMMRQPAATPPPQQRQAIVRGAAPEQSARPATPTPAAPSSSGWTPIRIPSPTEMGIASSETKPAPVLSIALPERYDMSTVTTWLDRQGARSCQREKLAEGIQLVCSFGANTPTITVRGNTDEEALQKMVQEVVRRKQELTLSQR